MDIYACYTAVVEVIHVPVLVGRVWEGMDVHRGAGTMGMSSGNQGTESMARVWMSERSLCV